MKISDRTFIFILIILAFYILFNAFLNIPSVQKAIATVTPTPYASVHLYGANETPFYQPNNNTVFVPVINIKDLITWRNNGYRNEANASLLISEDRLFFAGYLKESKNDSNSGDTTWREINVELLCLEISTGKVIWQDWIGAAQLATDGFQLYAPATNNFDDAGLVAYKLDSGEKIWETRFSGTAGVSAFWPLNTELHATAFNRGSYSSYILDKVSGKIKRTYYGEKRFIDEGTVISDGIGLKRDGFGIGPIRAYKIGIQDPLWIYSQDHAISNIAVDDSRAYWVTSSGRLVAVNIETGNVISVLEFFPKFISDFDYLNLTPVVAAGNGYVAIYFADQKQLSLFRFIYPAPQ